MIQGISLPIWSVWKTLVCSVDHFYTERDDVAEKTIWNNIVLEYEQYSLSYAILHNLELNKIQLVRSIIEGSALNQAVS